MSKRSRTLEGDVGSFLKKYQRKAQAGVEPIEGVLFGLNHPVQIIKGKYTGEVGSVISLVGLSHESKYYVELSSGNGVVIYESQAKNL